MLLGVERVTADDGLAVTSTDRHGEVVSARFEVDVDRVLARFGAWYELFPRSFGGFSGVAKLLPRLAELGFDVVYLPPIHPIGETNRKGPNNALVAGPDDPGSPWAIGSALGGHEAIHPELGTWADFDAMVAAARQAGVELALDFAIQCSPDHPWLREHPEWFNRRPDGTLKYAENPPKRYQDIYNVNFESEDWRGLWQALLDVVLGWVDRGITVFRVDNPHTKPAAFWEWLIQEVRRKHPEVLFLAEAFTRPSLMTTLAKLGFAQSYTYFTWKNLKGELHEYMLQLIAWSQFYRPNAFVNTPDILHEYLQVGGPPAFEARLVLAATLSPSYGIYSGFESFENVAVQSGSEEYLDSEKYQLKAQIARRPAAATRAGAERDAACGARAAAGRQPPLARDGERRARRVREGRCHLRREHRSVRRASRRLCDPGLTRLPAGVRGARVADRRDLHVARGPQLRPTAPGQSTHRQSDGVTAAPVTLPTHSRDTSTSVSDTGRVSAAVALSGGFTLSLRTTHACVTVSDTGRGGSRHV